MEFRAGKSPRYPDIGCILGVWLTNCILVVHKDMYCNDYRSINNVSSLSDLVSLLRIL